MKVCWLGLVTKIVPELSENREIQKDSAFNMLQKVDFFCKQITVIKWFQKGKKFIINFVPFKSICVIY